MLLVAKMKTHHPQNRFCLVQMLIMFEIFALCIDASPSKVFLVLVVWAWMTCCDLTVSIYEPLYLFLAVYISIMTIGLSILEKILSMNCLVRPHLIHQNCSSQWSCLSLINRYANS